ncbi:hypothetical protein B0H14DRAFT_2578946 [Mycena olivaceomarginata]|nr:hypothetical protein B0H14DRAFT_2578946 [Mycena olivaceomarginata]
MQFNNHSGTRCVEENMNNVLTSSLELVEVNITSRASNRPRNLTGLRGRNYGYAPVPSKVLGDLQTGRVTIVQNHCKMGKGILPHAVAAAAALQRQSAAVAPAAHVELLYTTRHSAALLQHQNTSKHCAAAVGSTLQRQSWHFAAAVGLFSAAVYRMLRQYGGTWRA